MILIPIYPDMINYNIPSFNILFFTFYLIIICGLLEIKILLKFVSRFAGRLFCRAPLIISYFRFKLHTYLRYAKNSRQLEA